MGSLKRKIARNATKAQKKAEKKITGSQISDNIGKKNIINATSYLFLLLEHK